MIFNCYYTDDIHPQIVEDHQKCSEKIGIKVNYFKDDHHDDDPDYAYNSHGKFLDSVMEESNEDVVCFIDIDCLPTNKEMLDNSFRWSLKNKSMVGNAQNVSHGGVKALIYAAPSLLMISKKLWQNLEKPSFCWEFKDGRQYDTAQNFTIAAEVANVNYRLFYPIGYDQETEKEWILSGYGKYGRGTLYPASWHYFRISDIKRNDKIPQLWSKRVNDILNNKKIIPNNYSPFFSLSAI